jgi:hypothetical protein
MRTLTELYRNAIATIAVDITIANPKMRAEGGAIHANDIDLPLGRHLAFAILCNVFE